MTLKLPLERLLTDKRGFGLTTATPLQRAICRISDGLPVGDLWEHDTVPQALGGAQPTVRPQRMLILAAIRSGKSLLAAAKAVQASQTVDLTHVAPSDIVRIPVLAVDKERAQQVYNHILVNVRRQPLLRGLLIDDTVTTERFCLRHPSGRPIEVSVQALARAGSTLVSTWLAGCIFDEAPRMSGSEDSKRSLEDNLSAIAGRVLDGGQIFLIGSPHAPFGPVYDMVSTSFGSPSEKIVVIRAPGPAMNPVYWTPKRCKWLQRNDPDAYITDVLAEFTDPEESMFSSVAIDECTRTGPMQLNPVRGHHYTAVMDPATRGNAWTLIILECAAAAGAGNAGVMPQYRVAAHRQWVGSTTAPLSPRTVLHEVAELCAQYGCRSVWTDQHQFDSMTELAADAGIDLLQDEDNRNDKLSLAKRLGVYLLQRAIELPPDRQIREDLVRVKKRVTVNGATLVLPRTSDGRHCDYEPVLAIGLAHPPEPPDEPDAVVDHELEAAKAAVMPPEADDAYAAAGIRLVHSR